MKTRTGFVSNSSASSFVVAFKKIPEDADELRQMLFGDDDVREVDGHKSLTVELSAVIFHDVMKQFVELPHPNEILLRSLRPHGCDLAEKEEPEEYAAWISLFHTGASKEEMNAASERSESAIRRASAKILEELKREANGAHFLVFEYNDYSGDDLEYVLTNGNPFAALPNRTADSH